MDDLNLLREYCERRSEESFRRLVERHADWVYSASLRQVGDAHLAEDVTQAVFIALARKAAGIRTHAALSAWLFKATRFASIDARRREQRRRRHETLAAAAMDNRSLNQADESWRELAPRLETLVARLRRRDREAIVLRFYEQKTLKDVGYVLGITEEAAKKRVSRALTHLRALCSKTGLTIAAAGISTDLLESNVTAEAPSALAASAANAASAQPATASAASAIAATTLKMITRAKARWAASCCAIGGALLAAGVIAIQLANGHLHHLRDIAAQHQPPTTRNGANPDPQESIRTAVIVRLQTLQSLSAEYELEESFFPRPPAALQTPALSLPQPAPRSGGLSLRIKTGVERSTDRFSFLNGSARWESQISAEKIRQDQQQRIVPITALTQTFSPGVYEQMIERSDGPSGGTESRSLPPAIGALDLGLGLRDGFQGVGKSWADQQGGWLTPDLLKQMAISRDADGCFIFSRTNQVGQRLEWHFDPAVEYALTSYCRRDAQDPYPIVDQVTASDFRPVNGFLLPFTITWRQLHTDGYEIHRWQATIKQYALNDPANTPDRYHIEHRAGMSWVDRRPPPPQVIAAGQTGDQSDPSTPRGAAKIFISALLNADARSARDLFLAGEQNAKELDALLEEAGARHSLEQALVARFGTDARATLPRTPFANFLQQLDSVEVRIDGQTAALNAPHRPEPAIRLVRSGDRWKVSQLPGSGPALIAGALMTADISNHLAAEIAQGKFSSAPEVAAQFNKRLLDRMREKKTAKE